MGVYTSPLYYLLVGIVSLFNLYVMIVRVGNNFYEAFPGERCWWTTWPDGEMRTCSPEEIINDGLECRYFWQLTNPHDNESQK